MPVPIGNFISEQVYDGKLKTVHPIEDLEECCVFVDADGSEERQGVSWTVSQYHTFAKRRYT